MLKAFFALWRHCLCVCVLMVLAYAPATAHSQPLTVFAAISLKEALDAQLARYRAATGQTVAVSYAASNVLAKQIEAGAPADIFISADEEWMNYLAQRQLIRTGSQVNLLSNRLVLIAPAKSTHALRLVPRVDLAAALGNERLAIANPQAVPAGRYAQAALQGLGAWDAVKSKLATGDSVRAALMLVARGEAPLGIVYATDARAEPRVRVLDTFDAALHPPIRYPAAITAQSKHAKAQDLLAALQTPDALKLWQSLGFITAY